MAIFSKQEFRETCGISRQYLNECIRRGQVILTGENIDTSIAENDEFVEKRLSKKQTRQDNQFTGTRVHVTYTNDEKKIIRSLSIRKRHAETEKAEKQVQELELKVAKLMRENIEMENVNSIIEALSSSMREAFYNGCGEFASKICAGEDKTRVRTMLKKIVDIQIKDGIAIAAKELNSLRMDIRNNSA